MDAPFAAGASVAARALGYRGLADLIAGDHLGPEQLARLFALSGPRRPTRARDLAVILLAGTIARHKAAPAVGEANRPAQVAAFKEVKLATWQVSGRRSFTSSCEPLFPSHELHADAVIVDEQISRMIVPDSAGSDLLHFLSHDPHIKGVIAPSVAEAIEFETVLKSHKRHDVFLKADVGTTPAATPATAAMHTTAAMHATGTMRYVSTADAVMRYVSTADCAAVMRYVVTCPMTRSVRYVVMTNMAPAMPASDAAPPQPTHPRTVITDVPAGSVPPAFVPTISATAPDVLRVRD